MDASIPTNLNRRQAGAGLNVAIVNYGMGNLVSVANAFARLGCEAKVTDDPEFVAGADAVVLPGVGAFGEAMRALNERELVGPLTEAVIGQGKPFLGICLGMQLVAEVSFEHGEFKGLGWIDAKVEYVPESAGRIPHVGWTDVDFDAGDPLFQGVEEAPSYYFDHSLHFVPQEEIRVAHFTYGARMVAAIGKDNIVATQFHPEKSEKAGLRLMRCFLNFCLDRPGAAN